jgi:hypothetical protein
MHKAYVASQCNPAQEGCDKCLPTKAFYVAVECQHAREKVSNIFKLSLGPPTLPIVVVNAKVELKSSIPIDSITQINPQVLLQ